ncbi:MAG TPA: flagellar filament capping protein FliD [Oscillospiraceae bacterium]|nr:flagellar filament capping protein FliD [Oscillospiraceae bacterium]
MATSSVSNSADITSTNLQTSSRPRVNGTGLASGLDTDTLIKQLTATTRSKIAKQQQKMQTAQWQRDAYRDVTTKMKAFSDKYFSYSATDTNILSSKFFDVATITNPSSLLTVSGNTDAAVNMQVGSISQLARQASFSSSKPVANDKIQSGLIQQTWVQSNVQAQALNFNLGSKAYSITVPQNVMLDTSTASTDPNNSSDANKMAAMQKALQDQIDSNADLKGKLTVGVSGSSFTLTNSDTANPLKIVDGDLAKSLGFSKDATGATITGSAITGSAMDNLYVSKNLGDALAGSALTFTLNGISKDVNFNLTDKSQYSTIADMRNYVQKALDTAYGVGKITVGSTPGNCSSDGKSGDLTFKTADTTSVLSINSSDNSNVLNECGALRIGAGESNRLELGKTLKQLRTVPVDDFQNVTNPEIPDLGAPDASGNYKINVNGKEFTFSEDTTLNSVMSQINNDATANVTISYSSITNKFNVTAKGSGASSTVNISDVTGNLAASLFGTAEKAIQSSSAITSSSLQTSLSGSTLSFTLGGTQKTITFDPADSAQYATADGVRAYLQSKLDSSDNFGSNKVIVSNNSGILKFTSTDPQTVLSVDSSSSSAALGALNITASATTIGTYSIKDGQDAKLKVSFDGGNTFTNIDRSENTFSLDGVNFGLLGTTDPTKSLADTTIKFTSNSNADALYTKINDFVTAYNDVVNLMNGYVSDVKAKDPAYPPLSDEQKTQMTDAQITDWNKNAKKGILQNDETLSQISSDMRTVMTSIADGTNLKALSKIGISTSAYDYDPATNGKLIVNADTLKKAITENVDDVADLFTNSTNGISTKLKKVIDANVGSFGGDGRLIALAGTATTLADQSTLSKSISDYASNIKDLNKKLSDEQDRYWAKFTAMETQLSNLSAQSNWLSQQAKG